MGKGEGESLVEGREKIRFLKNNREKHGIPEKYRRDFFFLLLKTNRATLLFKSPRDDLQQKIRGEIFFFFYILRTTGTTSSISSHSIQRQAWWVLDEKFWTTVAEIHPE